MESKYLNIFSKLTTEEARAYYRLNGARVLVELLPKTEIKSKGGLIISTPKEVVRGGAEQMAGTIAIVLLTGVGYINDDGQPIDLEVSRGTVCLLNDFSIKTFSSFPGLQDYAANTIALTEESAIQMQWPSIEAYLKYEAILNGN